MKNLIVTTVLISLAVGCSSNKKGALRISKEEWNISIQCIAIAPINTHHSLEHAHDTIIQMINSELQEKGMKSVSAETFCIVWERNANLHKPLYNPSTGTKNIKNYTACKIATYNELQKKYGVHAVLLPSIEIRRADVEGFRASWDGRSESIEILTTRRGISTRNLQYYEGTASAISLRMSILDIHDKQIYESITGIQLLSKIDHYGNEIEIPAKKLLGDKKLLEKVIHDSLKYVPSHR